LEVKLPEVLFFGPARDLTKERRVTLDGSNVSEVLKAAVDRYGSALADLLSVSQVWVNGEAADSTDSVSDTDEIAVIPPVSGG
jgi:molybdopterin converting factor small subunit